MILSTKLSDTLLFDAIVGYDLNDKTTAVAALALLLSNQGIIVLAERVPRHTQRLYKLVDFSGVEASLAKRVQEAEEAIYLTPDDPLVNWDASDLIAYFEELGFAVNGSTETEQSDVQVTESVFNRWFHQKGESRPSYAERLSSTLNQKEIEQVGTLFERTFLNQAVKYKSHIVYIIQKNCK